MTQSTNASVKRKHQSRFAFIQEDWMVHFPGRHNFTFNYPLPSQTVRGLVCNHVHSRVTHRKLAVLADVGVQSDDIHIIDFFPLLNSVICFCGLGSTPVKGISDIYWRIFDKGVGR